MDNLRLLAPEMTLAALALALMVADLFIPARRGKLLYHLAWIIAAIALVLVGLSLADPARLGVGTLWTVDPMSQFFKILVLATTILCLLLGLEYKQLPVGHAGSFSALLLFSAIGLMFLVSSLDLLLVFISLELVSLSSFILTGFERRNPKSNEGSLKYFLFGAFSSAVMVFGISLYYGATGTTMLTAAPVADGPLYTLGLLLVLLGFGFKASIAPMHYWVPDAYEGAPTPVTAFLSIAPKIATMGILARLFTVLIPAGSVELTTVLAILSGLTMTVGNFPAMFQTNVKRLLAYSSVAHAGYILIGIVAGDAMGLEGVMLYSLVYIAMNIGAFAVAQAVGDDDSHGGQGNYELSAFDGLSKRSFGLALCMTFFLLSLAGIPPLSGFIGKFYIFSAAMNTGHYTLAVIGVINSVVSVYYYMRIVYHMFLAPSKSEAPVRMRGYVYGALAVAVVGVLAFGILPQSLVAAVQSSAQFLP